MKSYKFTTRIVVPALTLVIVTILHQFLFTSHLSDFNSTLLLFLIVILCFSAQYYIIHWAEKRIKVVYKPTLLDTENKRNEKSRLGLIVFLSLYNLSPAGKINWKEKYGYDPDSEKDLFKEDVKNKNLGRNFEGLLINELACTNLGPAIKAIQTHSISKKLKHIWIISTESTKNPNAGSKIFVETFKEFLQQSNIVEIGIDISTFRTISIDEDSQVVRETDEVLSSIYKEAAKKKIPDDEIIVDVTSGTVSMTTGAVLASIGRERDIQILVAGYEAGGLVRMKDVLVVNYQVIQPHEVE